MEVNSKGLIPLPLVSLRKIESLLGAKRDELRAFAKEPSLFYRSFTEPKASGGVREIDTPRPRLKQVQKRIAQNLLSAVPLPDYVLGGVRGYSIVNNADAHRGRPCILRIDIKAFFPTVDPKMVYRVFRERFEASPKICALLTEITTYKHRLPQGAPTSPRLATLASLTLFSEVHALCARGDVRFTIWCDDLFFSGSRSRMTTLIQPVVDLVRRHGFAVSPRKVKLMSSGVRQEVTGVVVNRGLSVGRSRYLDELRKEIRSLAGRTYRGKALQRLAGKFAYVRQVRPGQGYALGRLAASVGVDLRDSSSD